MLSILPGAHACRSQADLSMCKLCSAILDVLLVTLFFCTTSGSDSELISNYYQSANASKILQSKAYSRWTLRRYPLGRYCTICHPQCEPLHYGTLDQDFTGNDGKQRTISGAESVLTVLKVFMSDSHQPRQAGCITSHFSQMSR